MPVMMGTVGEQQNGPGVTPNDGFREGYQGDIIVSELHGRFFEQARSNRLYSIGSTSMVALSANSITLVNTSTPIVAVWNPSTSPVSLVLLQAAIQIAANTLTAPVPPGGLVWAASVGNAALTLGNAPYNRKSMVAAGSQAKGFPGGVALTGLTNNLVIIEPADFPNLSALTNAGTITAQTTGSNATAGANGVQNFDGSWVVPPGGIIALLNINSTITYSAAARLLWEEVPNAMLAF